MQTVFDDEFLKAINRRFGQIIMGAGGVIAVLTAAVVTLALKPKVPPYVVPVEHGVITGPVQPYVSSSPLGRAIVKSHVEEFIRAARTITTNMPLELHNMDLSYAIVRGQAYKALDAYYKQDDPRLRAAKGVWRDVTIIRCIEQPQPDTYLVEWNETLYPADNGAPVTSNWQASIGMADSDPDPDNTLNGFGSYAIAIDWAPQNQPPNLITAQ